VRCRDGLFGEVADVVIDPTRRRVTHLVVQPHRQHGLARLVPIALATADEGSAGINLSCLIEEVRCLEPVQEFAYLRLGEFPVADPDWDVGVENLLAIPYYGVGFGGNPVDYDPHVGVSYDRIPKDEVEIRRKSEVVSADDHRVGHVDGFLVDVDDQITHVVLEHGHLWGRRDVAIPISAVDRVASDAITLNLTRDEVGALPEAAVRRWA